MTTPTGLTLRDFQDLAEFRHQLRRFLQFSEERAREHGIEPQQHQALLALEGTPGHKRRTIGELAARLLLRHHTTVELVNRLELAGLVRRRPDPDDGRQMLIDLTTKGAQKLSALAKVHREELRVKGPELMRSLQAIVRRRPPH